MREVPSKIKLVEFGGVPLRNEVTTIDRELVATVAEREMRARPEEEGRGVRLL